VPEGHTIHRQAAALKRALGGRPVTVNSPQGRFEAGAALLDGRVLARAEANGKHLFLGFAGGLGVRPQSWLHVHLGLIGSWTFGPLDDGRPPGARGAVRVRLVGQSEYADLRGPTVCEVLTTPDVAAVRARLGADPLRKDADHGRAGRRVLKSAVPIGALLMQQQVVAGVGNVFRAEALFRARVNPWTPGRNLDQVTWDGLWADLVVLLKDGVRRGRIVTTLPRDRDRVSGAARPEDAHYVYRRTGLPCRICGTAVVTEPMVGRNLYRCVVCQTR
jgi:endonuclease VIII